MINTYHDIQKLEGARVLYLKALCKKDEKVAFIGHVPTIVKKTLWDKVKERFFK